MRILQLQYAPEAPDTKIVDDLTVMSRNAGPRGFVARVAFEDADFPGVRGKLAGRQVPTGQVIAPEPDPLPDDQAIVENGDGATVRNSAGSVTHNGTLVVEDGELEAVTLPAAVAMVGNSQAVPVQNSAGAAVAGTHAATVAAGAVSHVRLAATIAPVANSASVTVLPASGTTPAQGSATAAVAAGAITGVRLPATSAVVTNGTQYTVDGGTVTLNVSGNAVTATFTPDDP